MNIINYHHQHHQHHYICYYHHRLNACVLPKSHIKIPVPDVTIFPGVSDSKESTCNAGDLGSIPGLGRSPGDGNGSPHQCSGLDNPMDSIVYEVAKRQMQPLLGALSGHVFRGHV